MDADRIDGPEVRRLLAELLPSASEFDAFCLDYFPTVHRLFGNGMDRIQKENLLLQQADAPAAVVVALRAQFPKAQVWETPARPTATPPIHATNTRVASAKRRFQLALVSGGLIGIGAIYWSAMSLRLPQPDSHGSRAAIQSDCGALALDDVFLIKEDVPGATDSLQLDVRLRHTGAVAGVVNVSRVIVDCTERKEERSPVAVSATYDLLIRGDHNEAAIAQQLKIGEVDRILLRLGFTQDSAAYQYTAKLRLQYNGACTVESAPFTISRDSARHPALVAPWPGKPAGSVRQ